MNSKINQSFDIFNKYQGESKENRVEFKDYIKREENIDFYVIFWIFMPLIYCLSTGNNNFNMYRQDNVHNIANDIRMQQKKISEKR